MHMLFLGLWVRAVPVVSGGAILDMADDTITGVGLPAASVRGVTEALRPLDAASH